ncbi:MULTISPECIES: NHL repeat-containing protein [Bradyrhizobium]|uniref:NHL repeat-containing protein n=1 Tax=Bradyrhizobium zhengyangense TaxID=2911009 RepID=A0A9X1RCF3_9BRAD|nr:MULTISPECIES: NHL repeat-containing protein [Bradyrhizobium]MCG2628119.1 NHL repeat-containing protein [Bradyrhizobium zhengyangense]MDN5002803.1 NHL repeat-containing protein [Bradyrhizobium sp. WYCCWR 12677]MCG2643238.1 NHL repeat-containing protein [Bradyrhizobium zhengyangense]MCG2670448.1 NHL repeat-containing protein [Bradyrhizobium zhengyangense]MDN4985817.1 NHL repeat-containing protein [Bradyrhizobium sp. WYCCWR 13022]
MPRRFLSPAGARVILGGEVTPDGLVQSIVPSAQTLFGPRGVCLDKNGPMFVCDSGHHRLLIWSRCPSSDQAPADILIGQSDFSREGRNAKRDIGPDTLNFPTGVAAADGILAVADAWNHRILIWNRYPSASNQPADVVLGQADFVSGLANRGRAVSRSDTLNWCYGVAIFQGRLIVCDTGNRRVLIWNGIPTANGTPADLVLGQRDFVTRDDNAGGDVCATSMRWPHGIACHDGALAISDAGNNRVMVWRHFPTVSGTPCDFVLGQDDFAGVDHNRSSYDPSSSAMSMPYGLVIWDGQLVVCDTANSRLLGFHLQDLAMDAPATGLAAQNGFADKGDNRWRAASRDSLCWPYAASAVGRTLAIADTGNNRILIWDKTP